MTFDWGFIAGLVAASAAFGCWCVYRLSHRIELRRNAKEISRFRLFEARDTLVMLVVEGKMKENDGAWQMLYRSVNAWLNLNREMNAWHMAVEALRSARMLEKDEQLSSFVKKAMRREKEAAERVPEFAKALEEIDAAMSELVLKRTTLFHLVSLTLLALQLRILVAARDFSAVRQFNATESLRSWRLARGLGKA